MRSPLLTGVAVCLALLAATVAAFYLDVSAWANLLIGILVLAAPLVATAPLTRQRLVITALMWTALGLPGGYFFGVSVFYAGILLGGTLLIDVAITRCSARTEQASPATLVR